MKKTIKLLAIAFAFVVMAFGGCVYLFAPRPPKEAKLIQNFNEHRAAFEQLRDMLQADTNLWTVSDRGIEIRQPPFRGSPTEANFPTDRFNKYQVLLKEVGGLGAGSGDGKHHYACISIWQYGLLVNLRHIDILWLEKPPTNQVSSLEGYLAYSTNADVVFKHIDQNWYFSSDGLIPAK